MSRLRPGKAFKAAERISSCLEHTLLFASANKNPPTDGLELADIGTLPVSGAWLALPIPFGCKVTGIKITVKQCLIGQMRTNGDI